MLRGSGPFWFLGLGLLWGMVGCSPAQAGGFAVFDQSSQAAALGGAFTARFDDPSSLFYNVAGAAFFDKKAYSGGALQRANRNFTFETTSADFGLATVFDQDTPSTPLVFAYTVQPVKPYLNLGTAVYAPFDLQTTWNNQDTFPGRTISLSSELTTLDLNQSAALRVGKSWGVGLGLILRTSELTLLRRLETENFPVAELVDFASFEVNSGQEVGLGWNFGLLHRASSAFTWGIAYRSAVKVDYAGDATLTQIATGNDVLDDLLTLTNPFDQDLPVQATVEFPDVASAGITLGSGKSWLLAVDVNWTGWSTFQALEVELPSFPLFSQTIDEGFQDTFTYRLGLELTTGFGAQFRLGYVFDETPQPLTSAGPFFFDADKNVFSAGFGLDWLDVAANLEIYDDRQASFDVGVEGMERSVSGLFQADAITVSITVKKKPKLE